MNVVAAARSAAAEAIGTFFLVLIGPGAVMLDARSGGHLGQAGISLAFAFVITAMVSAFGPVSGAHINPAVTIALWSVRRFPGRRVPLYVAAQCLGAIAASLTLRSALGDAGSSGATLPAVTNASAAALESLMSFALMTVIMAAVTWRGPAVSLAPLAIGLTVGFCALTGGPMTGASMNPARSLGPAIVSGHWRAHWIYWACPIIGMIVAARTWEVARPTCDPDGARSPESH